MISTAGLSSLKAQEQVLGDRVADAMVTCPKTHASETELDEIRALFVDDHVHMALIVAADGRLVTTIERSDLAVTAASSVPAESIGVLAGRTVGPSEDLDGVTATMVRERRRRIAVIDSSDRLLGLLCRKRDGTSYCSDAGVRARAAEAAKHPWLAHA